MVDASALETLLQNAIALLEQSGFPMAAETLRDNLRSIRTAPTAAARRRRVFLLRDLCDGSGPGPDVFQTTLPTGPESVRYRRTEGQRRDEERYRATLEAIQRLLAPGATEAADDTGCSASMACVA
jgi:hypothetical protein